MEVLKVFIIKLFKKFQQWKSIWRKKENSFITSIFEGAMITEIKCLSCNH